jgi:alkaline phosphatase
MKTFLINLTLFFILFAAGAQEIQKPLNIILIIGDGMGTSHISAAYYQNQARLTLLSLPVTGLMSTHAHDNLVTDSGAAGTALSCGIKTYNGAIGVNADTVAVPSILEILRDKGYRTGIIATSSITHATPASFYAHQPSRKLDEAIAADFVKSGVDIAIGGGRAFFENRKKDKRNLSLELKNAGYLVTHAPELNEGSLESTADSQLIFTADEQPGKWQEGRKYLPAATHYALRFLKQKSGNNGFFLMVESSQIDWGGHDKDGKYVLNEMLEMDEAVAHALQFAKEDGNTLLIVLADHETGGLSVNKGSTQGNVNIQFTTSEHTATFVPVFAYGPGSALFSGFYDNTQIKGKLLEAVHSQQTSN